MDDLVKRLRENCGCNLEETPCGAEDACRASFQAAARIEELEAQVREAALALTHLERCARVVSERGATTGPQWTRLTVAILKAREVLKRMPPPAQTEPRMVQSVARLSEENRDEAHG